MGTLRGAVIGVLSGAAVGCAAVPVQAMAPWAGTQLAGAAENPVFLEAMTLQLARQMELEGARPYALEILVEGEGAPRVREVAQMFPAEVEALVASGTWMPADLKEWKWLVMSALNEELDSAFPKSLALSLPLEGSPTRWMAAGLLFDGTDEMRSVVMEGFAHADPRNRAFTALAVSSSGAKEFLPQLAALMDDGEPWARAFGIAALVRLGDARGTERGRILLTAPVETMDVAGCSYLLEALERAAPDPEVLAFVESLLPSLKGANRLGALGLLSLHRPSGRATSAHAGALRAAIGEAAQFDPALLRGVRALARGGSEEDVATLAALAGRENTLSVELELAVGLARAGHPAAKPLLKAATLELPWSQSLLAAGCSHGAFGEGVLLEWLLGARRSASPESLRRLGWAIGRWEGSGGIRDLESAAEHAKGLGAALQAARLGQLSHGS